MGKPAASSSGLETLKPQKGNLQATVKPFFHYDKKGKVAAVEIADLTDF
jgi:hypothetical protein